MTAFTVTQYLAALPADRRAAAVRQTIEIENAIDLTSRDLTASKSQIRNSDVDSTKALTYAQPAR